MKLLFLFYLSWQQQPQFGLQSECTAWYTQKNPISCMEEGDGVTMETDSPTPGADGGG